MRGEKILCAWNALMITGLATAGRCLVRDDYVYAASGAADYLRNVHWDGDRLLAASRDGRAHLNAYLDDYAFLLEALLTLLAARWRNEDLVFATTIAGVMLERFEDREHGGFFFTSSDHEALLQRTKTFADESLPSGNGVAARALLRLGHLLREPHYLEAAERTLRAGAETVERWPSAHAAMLLAQADALDPPPTIIVRTEQDTLPEAWSVALTERAGARGAVYVIPESAPSLPDALAARVGLRGNPVTAWVCAGHACAPPVARPDDLQPGRPGHG